MRLAIVFVCLIIFMAGCAAPTSSDAPGRQSQKGERNGPEGWLNESFQLLVTQAHTAAGAFGGGSQNRNCVALQTKAGLQLDGNASSVWTSNGGASQVLQIGVKNNVANDFDSRKNGTSPISIHVENVTATPGDIIYFFVGPSGPGVIAQQSAEMKITVHYTGDLRYNVANCVFPN